MPALVEAIEKTTDYVRTRYVEAVAAIGPAAAAAEPVLRGLMGNEEEPFQRLAAATALFRIGLPSKDLLPVVVEAARSGAPGLRRFAITCLGQFGAEAAGATGLMAEALQDPEVVVRACAAEALGRIGPPAVDAVPALQAACSDGDRRVQSLAASALRKIRGE
ncbi:MAG: HEAT repeat domain-containing protein [Planctomycetes bacterium]|nr:HEAT repeat domain-containing protein [Planctomycetota bacterium]